MESALRQKWMDRLISHIIPHGKDFSQIQPLLTAKDLAKEVRHLVGSTRFRTLRVHCLNLEFLLTLGLRLPCDEIEIRNILNKAEELELTSSRLSQMWNTLVWVIFAWKAQSGINTRMECQVSREISSLLQKG